jgi:hypothetical protein
MADGRPRPAAAVTKVPQPRPRSAAGPPLTLGNMRSLGVRKLAVACTLCHHQGPARRRCGRTGRGPGAADVSRAVAKRNRCRRYAGKTNRQSAQIM